MRGKVEISVSWIPKSWFQRGDSGEGLPKRGSGRKRDEWFLKFFEFLI